MTPVPPSATMVGTVLSAGCGDESVIINKSGPVLLPAPFGSAKARDQNWIEVRSEIVLAFFWLSGLPPDV